MIHRIRFCSCIGISQHKADFKSYIPSYRRKSRAIPKHQTNDKCAVFAVGLKSFFVVAKYIRMWCNVSVTQGCQLFIFVFFLNFYHQPLLPPPPFFCSDQKEIGVLKDESLSLALKEKLLFYGKSHWTGKRRQPRLTQDSPMLTACKTTATHPRPRTPSDRIFPAAPGVCEQISCLGLDPNLDQHHAVSLVKP